MRISRIIGDRTQDRAGGKMQIDAGMQPEPPAEVDARQELQAAAAGNRKTVDFGLQAVGIVAVERSIATREEALIGGGHSR